MIAADADFVQPDRGGVSKMPLPRAREVSQVLESVKSEMAYDIFFRNVHQLSRSTVGAMEVFDMTTLLGERGIRYRARTARIGYQP